MAERTVNVKINYVISTETIQKAKAASDAAQKSTDNLRKASDEAGKSLKNAGDSGKKSFMDFNNILKTVSIAVITHQLIDFTKEVIKVRGEFQKFEAILTNTLGSKSQALIALGRISEFAKSTPFGVNELTSSFIKLANRGIEPTLKEMRAIADLSATLGKSFEQVVEAIIDINNPERWKEIGVKATTAGGKVTLSFREQSIAVDATVRGVTDAVAALGQLNGVAGSTEAISKTLAGQTSNLADAWELFYNALGKGNEGPLSDTINLLQRAIELATEFVKSSDQKFEELESKTLASETEYFTQYVTALGSTEKARDAFLERTQDKIEGLNRKFKRIRDSMEKVPLFNILGDSQAIEFRNRAREIEMDRLKDLIDIYMNSLPEAIDETVKKLEQVDVKKGKLPNVSFKVKIDDKESAEEFDRIREEFQKDADKNKIKVRLELTDEEKNKIQDEAYAYMSGILQSDDGPKIELGDILFGTGDEQKKSVNVWKDEWRNILAQGFSDTANFLQGIEEAELEHYQNRISQIKSFYDEQMVLAGDNERHKNQLRLEEQKKVNESMQKLAEKEWKAKRNAVLLNTAAGIAQNLAQYPFPYWIVPVAITAAQGAAQLAATDRARPRFAKGVLNIDGPGTSTSDSIPAYLSKGESVMTASETRRSMGILEAIKSNKIDDKILNRIDFSGGRTVQSLFSDERIVNKLDEIRKGQYNIVKKNGMLFKQFVSDSGDKHNTRIKRLKEI